MPCNSRAFKIRDARVLDGMPTFASDSPSSHYMPGFKHRTEPFGVFTKHIFERTEPGYRFVFVPEFGAHILELKIGGRQVMDGYLTPAELSQNRWYKNSFLFPFANRVAGGLYEWADTVYEFPLDDSVNGNAIHGFGSDKPFELTEINLTGEGVSVVCTYHDAGDHPGYPFPFSLDLNFLFGIENSFEIRMIFRNTGQCTQPLSLGWHPYFQLGPTIDEMRMRLPECSLIGVNAKMLPTGKCYEYDEFESLKPIGATVLDNCFILKPGLEKAEIILEGKNGRLVYRQDTGAQGFNYFQVFTPISRNSIAIEPMTGNVDSFNTGEGLIHLPAGATWSGAFGFQFYPEN